MHCATCKTRKYITCTLHVVSCISMHVTHQGINTSCAGVCNHTTLTLSVQELNIFATPTAQNGQKQWTQVRYTSDLVVKSKGLPPAGRLCRKEKVTYHTQSRWRVLAFMASVLWFSRCAYHVHESNDIICRQCLLMPCTAGCLCSPFEPNIVWLDLCLMITLL